MLLICLILILLVCPVPYADKSLQFKLARFSVCLPARQAGRHLTSADCFLSVGCSFLSLITLFNQRMLICVCSFSAFYFKNKVFVGWNLDKWPKLCWLLCKLKNYWVVSEKIVFLFLIYHKYLSFKTNDLLFFKPMFCLFFYFNASPLFLRHPHLLPILAHLFCLINAKIVHRQTLICLLIHTFKHSCSNLFSVLKKVKRAYLC